MEQRCPADKRVRRHAVQHARCVFEHVVYMVRRALLEAFHGHELRKHGSQHVDRGRERASGMLSKQQALQLVGDALGGDAGQQPLFASMPSKVFGSMAKPSSAANRQARSMRRASSEKRRSGSPTARMIRASKSACPP